MEARFSQDTLTRPVDPEDQGKSLVGRVFFVNALSSYTPELLESLKIDVLDRCRYFAELAMEGNISEGAREEAQVCYDNWLADWQITDQWLVDTMQQSLRFWAKERAEFQRSRCSPDADGLDRPLQLYYGSNEPVLELHLSEFRPRLTDPFPRPVEPFTPEEDADLADSPLARRVYETMVARETPGQLKARLMIDFEKQVDEYVADCENRLLDHRKLRRYADWTALFQFGITPKEIVNWEYARSETVYSQARIQQVVKHFAEMIGLTIRPPKAGRKAKGKKATKTL